MQVFSRTFLKSIMYEKNERVETLVCLENIPHEHYQDFSFGKNLDYEVLGIQWENNTYVILNDWGEAEEITIGDPRFKIDSFAPSRDYPVNFLLGVGMNQQNQWKWFK